FREDKLGPAICAFSNDLPDNKKEGYLLLGVRDDGTTTPGKSLHWFLSNKYSPSEELGFVACISSRITTVIQVVGIYQINYN
ncbi:MAG: hypothetical protein AAF901_13040, partial [Bacteroidota bacterium]